MYNDREGGGGGGGGGYYTITPYLLKKVSTSIIGSGSQYIINVASQLEVIIFLIGLDATRRRWKHQNSFRL